MSLLCGGYQCDDKLLLYVRLITVIHAVSVTIAGQLISSVISLISVN